ncbi:LCP family protein [Aquihabitans daechungensis]|uniref:LCP family protein n=1 Tax=Aquihabitans daechungensis TaxID=1052257 RepID=UPI003B9FDCD1
MSDVRPPRRSRSLRAGRGHAVVRPAAGPGDQAPPPCGLRRCGRRRPRGRRHRGGDAARRPEAGPGRDRRRRQPAHDGRAGRPEGRAVRRGRLRRRDARLLTRALGPARADTILLARVDPGKETLTMLSIPRDLLVHIPGHGLQRINAAYAFGGPGLLVDTIDQNLGIEVDRYIETDFRGAASVGDALGGLSLSFPAPVRDGQTGLDLPAGCSELDGSQLLAVARSRHLRYLEDGSWKTDGTSDLGRMIRQQAIGTALLQRLTELDLSNPVELNRLLDAVVDDLTVDSGTTSDDLLALFRGIEGSTPVSLRYPVADLVHEGAAVLELGPGADQVTAAFLDVDEPQPPSAPTADDPAPDGATPSTTTSTAGSGSVATAPPTTPAAAIPTPC